MLTDLPPLLRAVVLGALVGGGVGAVTGLVVGLLAYPPTAWAATIEVGLPAAFLGAVVGLAVALTVGAVGRLVGRARR